jgi:[ribosomal protein S18]-alanine N-acetyltransferase
MAPHLFDSPPVPASQSAIDRDPDLRIRPARPDDAGAILQLETLFPGDRMSARTVRRFLTVPSAHVWVAEQAGVVVGNLIWLSRRGSRAARIYSLVVAPAARGFGLAERQFAQRKQRPRRCN